MFDNIDQPAGKSVCSDKNDTEVGTCIMGLNLETAILPVFVFPTVIIRSTLAPTDTLPEFFGNTWM